MKQPPDSSGRFRPAVLTPHELVRGRLLERVTAENALGAPHCTLIVGPAGFGKTTLLAQHVSANDWSSAASKFDECVKGTPSAAS